MHRWCLQRAALFGDRAARRIKKNDFEFLVEPRQNIDVYLRGVSPDSPVERFIRTHVVRNASILDIGANLGWTARLMSALAGPEGTVHAFEPLPSAFANLVANISDAPFKNIVAHPVAVADYCGKLELFLASDDATALATIRAPTAGAGTKPYVVDVVSIDSLIGDLPRVDFIKIDVEGAEHKVLQGMRSLIARDHPVMAIELSDAWLLQVGSSVQEVLRFLTERGYRMFWVDGDNVVPLTSPPSDQLDVVCVPSSA